MCMYFVFIVKKTEIIQNTPSNSDKNNGSKNDYTMKDDEKNNNNTLHKICKSIVVVPLRCVLMYCIYKKKHSIRIMVYSETI